MGHVGDLMVKSKDLNKTLTPRNAGTQDPGHLTERGVLATSPGKEEPGGRGAHGGHGDGWLHNPVCLCNRHDNGPDPLSKL